MAKQDYMMRTYAGITFQQERKTGMINITPLFENQAQLLEMLGEKAMTSNEVITKENGISRLNNYFNQAQTKKLLTRLMEIDNLTTKQVKRTSRAKDAVGTFVHPVVFVDAMSWISVDFKIWANKLVMDELIKYRNLSAQSNPLIAAAFDKAGFITNPAYQYGTLNIVIGDACDCPFEQISRVSRRYNWEEGSKEQLMLRENIQQTVVNMIKLGIITSFEEGIAAIKGLATKFN